MQDFILRTKSKAVEVKILNLNSDESYIGIFVLESGKYTGNSKYTGEDYFLSISHYNKLSSYKSVSALIKYASANQSFLLREIFLQLVTPCPDVSPTYSSQRQDILTGDDTPTPCPVAITNAPYSGNDGDGASLLFCDTETTGLGRDAEVVEIAIVDENENILFESLVMNWYADYWGQWSDYHQSYKWQCLVDACRQQKIPIHDIPNHRASGDAIKAVRLYKHLCAIGELTS